MKKSMVAKRRGVLERLEGYFERSLLPALGLGGEPYDVEIPSEGTRSLVFFLTAAGRRLVVKCFTSPTRALRTVLTTRHMNERGAPVPRLLHSDLSLATLVRYGLVFAVEEAVAGRNLYEVTPTIDRLREAARTLAALHNITRQSWGGLLPLTARHGDYFEYVNARLRRRLEHLTEHEPELAGFAIVEPWFAAGRERVPRDRFHLCHLRISDTNVLFTDDGGAVLIDLVTARYGAFAIDLERALHRWCEDDDAKSEAFLSAYFEACEHGDRQEWCGLRDYFHASFHLTQAYRAGKSLARRPRRKAASRKSQRLRRRVRHHLVELIEVLSSTANAALVPDIDRLTRAVDDWQAHQDRKCAAAEAAIAAGQAGRNT